MNNYRNCDNVACLAVFFLVEVVYKKYFYHYLFSGSFAFQKMTYLHMPPPPHLNNEVPHPSELGHPTVKSEGSNNSSYSIIISQIIITK